LKSTLIYDVAIVYGLIVSHLQAESYPDQFFVIRGADSLLARAESVVNLTTSPDGRAVQLASDKTAGYIIFRPQEMAFPFNYGLPSWNGSSPAKQAYFKVYIRFPYDTTWSPWLTVGYWNKEWGGSYGTTSYTAGNVDIDEIELYAYQTTFQFKIEFYRANLAVTSPTLRKIALTLSDTRTTAQLDFNAINADNPPAIFIPTTFYYQYLLDPEIGGSICSPTSVSMILRSFGIAVDPLQFASDTKDPYWGIFGVWPRVVQHAAEYGLDGAVTQYRSWSQAYEVLARGGRIAMSVGKPLYSGHLMMLAGFTSSGDPIVHDPARPNGYGYIFNKDDLSHSWFDKGGISYTFYLDSTLTQIAEHSQQANFILAKDFATIWNYPNPFNNATAICLQIEYAGIYSVRVYDITGRQICDLGNAFLAPGLYQYNLSGEGLNSGCYFVLVRSSAGGTKSSRLLLLK